MKKFLYVVAALAILFLVTYTFIGGFSPTEVRMATSDTMYIVGVPFEGSMKDAALGNAFQQTAKLLDEQTLTGVLGNIYYNNPGNTSDSLKAFIGVIVPDTAITLPPGYQLRTITGGKQVVHAQTEANIAILPKKLYTAVFDYTKENKLKLEDFYVEWFPERNKGVVQVPVKK